MAISTSEQNGGTDDGSAGVVFGWVRLPKALEFKGRGHPRLPAANETAQHVAGRAHVIYGRVPGEDGLLGVLLGRRRLVARGDSLVGGEQERLVGFGQRHVDDYVDCDACPGAATA